MCRGQTAKAFGRCAEHVPRLDRMLTALEFRQISQVLRQAGDRILDNDEVPRLVTGGPAIGLTMTSERQIAANRRNAAAAPRSASGKNAAARTRSGTG